MWFKKSFQTQVPVIIITLAEAGFKIGENYFNLSKNGNLKEVANNLYKTMRKIKKRRFKSIAVIKIPNKDIGYAINDRLRKASNKWLLK